MRSSRDFRRLVVTFAGAVALGGGWLVLRPAAVLPPAATPPASGAPASTPPRPTPGGAVVSRAPATAQRPPGSLEVFPDPAARTAAASFLADAVAARRRGDLRATLALLRAAVERAPAVETRAALGALYLELGVTGAAEANLRAAVEGDPGNADRWIALANTLALKPDPMAAADALEHARTAEPGLRVTRDAGGRLARAPAPPAP